MKCIRSPLWPLGILLLVGSAGPTSGERVATTLTLANGRAYTAEQMLRLNGVTEVTVSRDPVYHRAMRYRAIRLVDLLGRQGMKGTIVARADDGFTSQLPATRVANTDVARAVAYVAIEDPARRWPRLAGKPYGAGPFYIVWAGRRASAVSSDLWPYRVARLSSLPDPEVRWPQLRVSAVRVDALAREGEREFVTRCLPCHTLKGAGDSHLGPDLAVPQSPTQYFRTEALRQYIRCPANLRDWPGRRMPCFDRADLTDRNISQIIAYLARMSPSASPDRREHESIRKRVVDERPH